MEPALLRRRQDLLAPRLGRMGQLVPPAAQEAPPPDIRAPLVPFEWEQIDAQKALAAMDELAGRMARRRSIRAFSREPVPRALIERCLRIATTAPSGANLQPWSFVVVTDPVKKCEIRLAAEAEEAAFYGGRAPATWLRDLAPLGTDARKEFLEDAPALIAIFAHPTRATGEANYYVRESVGIATGFLVMALHQAGLSCLTHTPSPMRFLETLLGRPPHERAYLLLPVGYPAPGCVVPCVGRRPFADTISFCE